METTAAELLRTFTVLLYANSYGSQYQHAKCFKDKAHKVAMWVEKTTYKN